MGCTTTRTYETSEASLRVAIPIAVEKTMHVSGYFDASSKSYFADLNMLGYAYAALKVTWQPAAQPGQIRVTADAYGYNCFTGTLIKYDDDDAEQEFHCQLKALLGSSATQPMTRPVFEDVLRKSSALDRGGDQDTM